MKIIQEYALTLVSLVTTLVLTVIADFVLRISDEGTFLVFATGAIVTLAVTLLQRELENSIKVSQDATRNEISQKLRLYDLLDKIGDKELQAKVFELAEQLSKGEIPTYITPDRSRQLIQQVSKFMRSSFQAETLQEIYEWKDYPRQRTWYEENLKAIARGVVIERNFLLRRSATVNGGSWDPRALEILEEQTRDGIQVRILWIEDLDYRPSQKDLQQTFNIFDDQEIIVTGSRYGNRIYRNPSGRVHEYNAIFQEQKKYAQELKKLLPGSTATTP